MNPITSRVCPDQETFKRKQGRGEDFLLFFRRMFVIAEQKRPPTYARDRFNVEILLSRVFCRSLRWDAAYSTISTVDQYS